MSTDHTETGRRGGRTVREAVDSRLPALETLLARVRELAAADPRAWARLRAGPRENAGAGVSIEGPLRELFVQLELVRRALTAEAATGAAPGHAGAGLAAIPRDEGPTFAAPWEARVFGLVVLLNQQGHFTWPEWVAVFSGEIETARAAGEPTHGAAYYALWLAAAEKLLAAKGLLVEEEYARFVTALSLEHPHAAFAGLMDEHRALEKVLDAFGDFAGRLENDAAAAPELRRFVDFLAGFAERCHHAKEEDLLFRAMVANGFPAGGAISVMQDEHAQGAAYLAALGELARGAWDAPARAVAAATIGRYVQLLRQHIDKEDHNLYADAHAQLPDAVLHELDRACREYDTVHAAERSRLLSLGEELAS